MKTLDDAADFLSGGTPRKSNPVYWGGSIPWYSASNMDSRYLGDTDVTITPEGLNSGSRIAPAGSTLILVRGSGLFNFVPICFAQKDVAFNQDVKALVPKKGIDPTFLHFWIESLRQDFNENIGTTGIGAGKFDTDFLRNLPFPDIDFYEQVARGIVSSAFDKKIDLLREMNRTLEEIARAVFRAWFVDFEPVRAKAAGATSFRGMPQALFDQLPDSFTPSDLGDIPTGWTEGELSELIDVNPTRSLKKGTTSTYLGMSDVPTSGPTAESWALRDFTSGMRFQNGDTLLARITPCLENGKTALVDFLADREVGWGSTEFMVLGPKNATTKEFIYCLARNEKFREYAIKNMTGTSGRQRVSHESISSYGLAKPPADFLNSFGRMAAPLFYRISANRDEMAVLADLRDTLLPKLISGELPAPDLEALGLTPTEPVEASDGG